MGRTRFWAHALVVVGIFLALVDPAAAAAPRRPTTATSTVATSTTTTRTSTSTHAVTSTTQTAAASTPRRPAATATPGGRRGTVTPDTANDIVLAQGGDVSVTKTTNATPACNAGNFGLSSPTSELIWADYGNPNVVPEGTTADVGTFAAGTALVFYIQPNGICGTQYYYSTDPNRARVTVLGPDDWQIGFEDLDDQGFEDLVVEVKRVQPAGQPAPAGSNTNPPLLDTAASKDPVNTLTGSFAYQHTDLAIPGRGPSPVFTRAYNTDDTRAGPLGPGWTDTYNIHLASPGDGTADLILDGPEGRSDRYVFGNGAYTPPPAVYTSLAEHPDGTFTATLKDQTVWAFSNTGRLTAITDRYGNTSTLTYTNGQLTGVGDPASRGSLAFGYYSGQFNNQLHTVTDWTGRVVTYTYDASNRLYQVTDRTGKDTTTYAYDGTTSHLASITDANSHVAVTMTFDSQGRVQTQTDALNNQTTFGYVTNQDGTQTTTVTYPATSYDNTKPTVADTYDTSGRLIKRVSQISATESYTEQFGYDGNGDLTSMTDARGNTTSLCYDVDYSGAALSPAVGNLTRVIAPAPTAAGNALVTLLKYDGKNNLLETIPPKGVTSGTSAGCSTNFASSINTAYATDYAYDSAGVELLTMTQHFTDPDKGLQTATTAYQYADPDNPGAVTAIVPPLTGHTTSFTYYNATSNPTEAGMLQQAKDALGDATAYAYDPVGNRTVVIDASGQVTKYLYDARDSLSEVDQSPQGWTVPADPPTTVYRTTYSYDNLGNLDRIDRATGDTNNERATDYQYDGLNRLRTELQYPAWPTTTPTLKTSYAYDGDNNRTSMVDPLNQETDYGYDADNRLTGITYKAGTTPGVAYAYDADGNRLTMADGTGTTTYAYDELNRLTSVTQADGQAIGYRYDTDGNRSELIYPGAHAVAYAYDTADRLQTVTDWSNRVSSYTYYADGQVQTLTNVDGSTAAYTYDPAQRLTQVTNATGGGATIDQHAYTLDNLGNPTQRQETLAQVGGGSTSVTTLYGYDHLNELTLAGPSGSQTTYCYDPVGNRVGTTAGCAPTITYDKADRVLQSGSTAYTVNANGDVTNRGADTFAYDQANRMTSATVNGTTTTSAYNGDGLRISQSSGGTATSYAWDVNRALPQLLYDGTRYYVYGLGLLYSFNPQGTTTPATGARQATAPDNLVTHIRVYHTDGLGSVRALTTDNGLLADTYQTDAFGANATQQGLNPQPFGYTGQQADNDGLVYLRARYYDPNTGRFMNRDPRAGTSLVPLSLNRYTYAGNDPTVFTDPSGELFPLIAAGALVGALVTTTAYVANAVATGSPVTARGVAGAAVADAVTGAVGAVAVPLAVAAGVAVDVGFVGAAVVDAAASVAAYGAESAIDPSTPFTGPGVAVAALTGATGGFASTVAFPTVGMTRFSQVGFPRTWRGVLPSFLGGRAGKNTINGIYRGGTLSAMFSTLVMTLSSDVMDPLLFPKSRSKVKAE